MKKTAVITGAGSGVGRAVAIALAQQDWNVALVGRRESTLLETMDLGGKHGTQSLVCTCDIGDAAAVAEMGAAVLAEFREVEVLVNAAGTNAPQRSLEVLSLADYHAMIDTNMNGAYYCVQAFLPQMRARGSGTIVNIVSDAAR